MSSAQLELERYFRPVAAPPRAAVQTRTTSCIAALASWCTLSVDVVLVLTAFVVAYWLRFVAPGAQAEALGFDHYLWPALAIGLLTGVQLAMHSLYDEEHPKSWPTRLHAILSTVSIALVVAVIAA